MIRLYENTDKEKITELWHNVFGDNKEYIEKFLNCYSKDIIIYEKNNTIISMLTMLSVNMENKKGRYIYAVATDSEYRGHGYATQLLKYAEDYIKKQGEKFTVLVPANKELFGFYEKLGYKTVKCIEKYEFSPEKKLTTKIVKINAQEYKERRKEILKGHNIIEWGEADLENIRRMYDGNFYFIKKFNAVMFCYPEREKLIIKELCCRKSDLDNAKKAVSGYFDKEKMEISNIGENPFAMIKPDIFEKVYFNIAMD